jgi:FkbM family methyltransferase
MALGLKGGIKNFILDIIPDKFRNAVIEKHMKFGKLSYAQEGEDVLLERIMGGISNSGVFIDIGAHHPIKYSNTYKLYKAGWRGLNIDATPGSMDLFKEYRHLDINVEVPISDHEEEMVFNIFNYPELNSFSAKHVKHWEMVDGVRLLNSIKMKTRTIESLLVEFFPGRLKFDLLSIDVEGVDFKILTSINFEKYEFKYIIVEDSSGSIESLINGPIYKLLNDNGYKLVSRLFYSTIYINNSDGS